MDHGTWREMQHGRGNTQNAHLALMDGGDTAHGHLLGKNIGIKHTNISDAALRSRPKLLSSSYLGGAPQPKMATLTLPLPLRHDHMVCSQSATGVYVGNPASVIGPQRELFAASIH